MSVIIPVLNEEADLEGCITAIAHQDLPLAEIEVVVVDGCSTDGTVEVAEKTLATWPFHGWRVLSNPAERTSTSLNVGLQAAAGEVIVRVDARSRIEPQYVRTCVEVLGSRPEVGVVGGAQLAEARPGAGVVARGIARALRNRYATGLSRYRTASTSGPSDTVWMGAFRAADLRRLGGWDPAVALNEDYALNEVYRRAGAVVWFEASLQSTYLARATYVALARQHFRFGRVKGTWWARGRRPNPRQAALLLAPPVALAAGIGLARRTSLAVGVALGATVLLAVDHAGQHESSGYGERGASVGAMTTVAASWWVGVLAGFAGERLGLEHRHG